MHKQKAIELLGGTIVLAADAIGISYQAVDKWPVELPDRISDRVLAVLARKHLPPELIGTETNPLPHIAEQVTSAGWDGVDHRNPLAKAVAPELERRKVATNALAV